jgi:glycosyltransferase involved in cell wall biosynthesis
VTVSDVAALGCVTFLGTVVDLAPAMANAHVLVHLSSDNGMPPALMAALATGRPVVTLDCPGCRDTVDQGVNGVLVAPGNEDQLVVAMTGVLENPGLLPSQSAASRRKAERRFNAREAMRTLMGLLDLPMTATQGA